MGFNFKPLFFVTQKVFWLVILVSCARTPVKEARFSLRPSSPPIVKDNWLDLQKDLEKYLNQLPKNFSAQNIQYQNQIWTGKEILDSYQDLLLTIKIQKSDFEINHYIQENFVFYEVYGNDDWSEVFVTGYFEPLYNGSYKKNKIFSHAALKTPEDLIRIHLKEFAFSHPQLSPHFDYIINDEKGPRYLSGRLIDKNVVPYPARKEILNSKDLHKPKNAIVWLDPIDLFFLQIQGSGSVKLPNGKEITIGYAAQNGHDYVAIGKFLTEYIPLKEMTADKIEDYLRSLKKEEMLEILNKNPSYVFFEKRTGRPLTSMGTEVIDGRSIASDSFYFTKGLIGFLEMQDPDDETKTIKKFVFNQDSGGAIKGPGRIDLFWGRGKEAGKIAGRTKEPGRLWFLLPKKLDSISVSQ